MSHEQGTYLGGIRSVECLRQRSRVDPDSGCWHWGLSLTRGIPCLHIVTPDTGKPLKARGRRAALYLDRGADLDAGQWAFARSCCNSLDCVNPAHARSGSRKQFGAWLKSSGTLKGLPGKIKASRDTWDNRGRTLTPACVEKIRSSTASTYALAAELGVSQCAVWLARRGKTHKHVGFAGIKASSVFEWRP